MGKKSNIKIFIFTVLFLVFGFCSKIFCETETASFQIASAQDDLDKDVAIYDLYLKSAYLHFGGQPLQAFKFCNKAIFLGASPYAYEEFVRILFDLNLFKKIVELQNKIEEYFDTDVEIQLIMAQSYLNLNQDEQAEKLFDKLTLAHPSNEQIAYYTAVSYIQSNQLVKAMEVIDKSLANPNLRSKHFLFYFLKSKILLQQGMNMHALSAIDKSLELYPKFARGWLFKALLQEQQGKITEAIKGYKNFLDVVGHDLAIEKQLVHLLFKQQKFGEAATVLRNIKDDTPEYFFDLALLELKAGNFKQALQSIDKAIEKQLDFRKAKLLKVEILLSDGNKKQALDFVANWLESVPYDNSVIHVLLLLSKSGVSVDNIIKKLEDIAKVAKDSVGILSVLADLYLEKSDYKNAIDYCKKLYAATKDYELRSKLSFQMGYIYFVTNQEKEMEKVLKKAINQKNVYPSSYNLLAYYYAKENKNLKTAATLIDKALEAQPDCFYYLDTKGYVLLKQGRGQQAIPIFEKALSIMPGDKTLVEHLKTARAQEK